METDTIKSLVVLSVLAFGSYLLGHNQGLKRGAEAYHEKTDTLYVCDTIVQYKPILEERVVYKKEFIPVTDTLRVRDTLYVYLEREQVVWQDSLSKIYASGIMPQIDSVYHFVAERVITREESVIVKQRNRWGLGVHAGYGIGLANGCVNAHPYIGIGVSYNLITW